jgi:hypothetical protein
MPAIIYPLLPLAGETFTGTSSLLESGSEPGTRPEAHPFDDAIGRVVSTAATQQSGGSSPARPAE